MSMVTECNGLTLIAHIYCNKGNQLFTHNSVVNQIFSTRAVNIHLSNYQCEHDIQPTILNCYELFIIIFLFIPAYCTTNNNKSFIIVIFSICFIFVYHDFNKCFPCFSVVINLKKTSHPSIKQKIMPVSYQPTDDVISVHDLVTC